MKNLFLSLLLFIPLSNLHAQTGTKETQTKEERALELISQKIEIDVDKNIFMAVTTNTYVSESPKGVIMAMLVPETYEKSMEKMKSTSSKDFKVEKYGELVINGVNVLYMEGTSLAEGIKLKNTIYCIKYDEETCMMVIGMMQEDANKKYFDAVEKALLSTVKQY